jgi:peptide/nickel transport system permease protein
MGKGPAHVARAETVGGPAEQVRPTPARHGTSPTGLAWARLRRNRVALTAAGAFVLIIVLCLLAPVYARYVAHTGPNNNHVTESITIDGHQENVVGLDGLPIGPTWQARFLLGADSNGRDTAVRALYGGRTSLEIGAIATVITLVGAMLLGVPAGFFRGWTDTVISRLLDLIWAYPALILGIALGVSLALGGLSIGPLHVHGGSNLVPALVIGVVFIPYVARPLRGEVLALREREFVDAARILGDGRVRIMAREVLPNLLSTLLVFAALQLAQSIALEAALSFLGAGVQPPNASWGTMLAEGVQLAATGSSLHLTLVPGVMLVATVLSVNLLGDGLRQAFDPRASVRRGH